MRATTPEAAAAEYEVGQELTAEIFAEGSGNTYGLEVDAQGRLYSGHNGGKTRGWHYVQGGFYQMQGIDPGKFGPPRNPYAFGDLPMMATSAGPSTPSRSSIARYDGRNP